MIMAATFLGSSHFIYFFIYFLGLLDKGHITLYLQGFFFCLNRVKYAQEEVCL